MPFTKSWAQTLIDSGIAESVSLNYGEPLCVTLNTEAYVNMWKNDCSDSTTVKDFENEKEKNMKKEVLFLAPGWQYGKTVNTNLSKALDKKKLAYASTPNEFETAGVHVRFVYSDPLVWTEEMFRGKSAVFGKKEFVEKARERFFYVMPPTPKMSLEKYIFENTMVNIAMVPTPTSYLPEIKKVHFSGPATTVIWADGTKTTVKCQDGDIYSKETGLALCIAKKALGNMPNFNNVFRKWIPEEEEELDLTSILEELKELAAVSARMRVFTHPETKKVKKSKSNPVEAAYDLLIAYRDSNMIPCMGAIEELIGYLGEALE